MRSKFLFALAVLALIAAACGGAATDETTTTAEPEPETTTTTVAEVTVPDAQLLSYELVAGTEYEYEVDLTQHIEMTGSTEGAAAEDEEFPENVTLDLSASAVFGYAIADGPEEGTYAVTVTGEFTNIEVSGTVDGESISSEGEIPDMADLAGIDPIDVTVIVDEQGNVIVDGEVVDDPMAGLFGGFEDMGAGTAPGLDPGQFVGVPFSDQEVTVGDSWSEEIEVPGLDEDPIVTSITSTVTGVEEVDGQEVLVIETSTETSTIEFDLGEFFVGLLTAFGDPSEDPELAEMLDQIRFLFVIDNAASDSVTWFDSEAGLTRRHTTVAGTNMLIDMNVPDETTGELAGMMIDMRLDQEIDYRLVSGPSA